MNEEYVTIKKSDYERLIEKYIYFKCIQNRAAHIKTNINVLENELNRLRELREYICFKKKIKLEINKLSDAVWANKNRYEELTSVYSSDHDRELAEQKFPVAENSKECHCSNETSKPAPA